MQKLRNMLLKNIVAVLTLIYFTFRLTNLTKLPIFNDESIYLDWGWREINLPGNAFLSLTDAKQPLVMWFFGIFQNLISDPLIAGRLVSVLFGYASFLGIYHIAKKMFGKVTAILSAMLYLLIPIFSFYDRQALMESALSAVDIWLCYFYLSFENNNKLIKIAAIGVLLGLGFFIKSSALIFFAPLLVLLTINLFKKNADKRKIAIYLLIILFISQIISLPLYLEKNFWLTLNTSSRFSLGLYDFTSLPVSYWINKTFYLLEILFWQLSPMVFIGLLIGAVFTIKKNNQSKIVLIWLVTTLFIATVFVRNFHPRYIVSFLPLSALIYSTGLAQIKNWDKKIYYLIIGFTFITLIPLTVFQIATPIKYLQFMDKLTKFSLKNEYLVDWTSGYGIQEAVSFLSDEAKTKQIIAAVRSDAGNPESAIYTYFNNSKNILPVYLNLKSISHLLPKIDCIKSQYPLFFITRDNNTDGLDKYFEEMGRYYKLEKKYYVGVYRLRQSCTGETIYLNYSPTKK